MYLHNSDSFYQYSMYDCVNICVDFMAARKTLDTGKVVYQDVVTSCVLSSVAYHTENVTSEHFTVSRDFALAVCRLPVVMDATHMDTYFQFIDTWGTVSVMVGFLCYKITTSCFGHYLGRHSKCLML